MKKWIGMIGLLIAGLLSVATAENKGGYIQGVVTLASSVKNWDQVVVVVCVEADPTCAKPAAVFKAKPAFATARSAAYTSPRLGAGKYTVYALNDKNNDVTHDPDTEELGGYFVEGTFDTILIEPTKLGVQVQMIGF
jgi:uncharacterized protein (DUF2141 family)